MTATAALDAERIELLETLATHRFFLRNTVRGLTDEQARMRTTASELTLGGLIKHVAQMEENWARFVVEGPAAVAPPADASGYARWADGFRLLPEETLGDVLARYAEVAAGTDELVRRLPDLGESHPLPDAPWFEPGARRSARRVFLHLVAETAQHAGHADIIRESLDGQKSMG